MIRRCWSRWWTRRMVSGTDRERRTGRETTTCPWEDHASPPSTLSLTDTYPDIEYLRMRFVQKDWFKFVVLNLFDPPPSPPFVHNNIWWPTCLVSVTFTIQESRRFRKLFFLGILVFLTNEFTWLFQLLVMYWIRIKNNDLKNIFTHFYLIKCLWSLKVYY